MGSDGKKSLLTEVQHISIHAPRVGSDPSQISASYLVYGFQSTLPVWGATVSYCNGLSVTLNFNPRSPCGERHRIHLATGSTAAFQSTLPVWGATGAGRCRGQGRKISIHAPRVGSDPGSSGDVNDKLYFNPRSPCGERPGAKIKISRFKEISIHAPRVGSDSTIAQFFACNFAQK